MRRLPAFALLLAAVPAWAQSVPPSAGAPAAGVSQAAQQADIAYRQGEYADAIKAADAAIRSDAQDHTAYYIRGSAKVEGGLASGDADMVRSGVADAREAIRIEGNGKADYYLPYLYGMTNLATLEGKPQHAETVVKVVDGVLGRAALGPDEEANLRYQKALAHMRLEKPDRAAAELQKAIKISPRHMAAQMMLADAYVIAGKPEQAETVFGDIIAAFPGNPLAYNNRGMFRQSQGDVDGAVADFDAAVKAEPTFYQAMTNKGFALMRAGRGSEAVAAFDASLKANPEQPHAVSFRGTTRLNSGDLRGAAGDYREVLKMDPRNPAAHADLGFVYFFAGQYGSADKSFANAQKVDPQMRFLNPWRYHAMASEGQKAQADRQFGDVAQKSATQLTWPDRLTLYLMGRMDESQLLSAVDRTDAKIAEAQTTEANYFIGLNSLKAGNKTAAAASMKKAAATEATNLSAHRGAKLTLRRMGTVR